MLGVEQYPVEARARDELGRVMRRQAAPQPDLQLVRLQRALEGICRDVHQTWYPFSLSALSTQLRSTVPALICFIELVSFARIALAEARIASACSCGTTTSPSASPTMMSPGFTGIPPMTMGTLISPGPFLYGPRCVTPLANTGKLPWRSSAESRIAPQITMPPTPRCSARALISSPMMAWSLNPPASTTITSPGAAVSIALCTSRLSPGAVRTVNAGPHSLVPSCIGRSCGPPAYRRSMLSERCGVTICASSAMSFLSGRLGMGRMRKPIAVMVPVLDELHRDSAQRAEVAVQRVALLREHHTGERAGEDQVAGLERHAALSEAVREPGHAERGMPEHAGGESGLLDLGIAIHDAADPA